MTHPDDASQSCRFFFVGAVINSSIVGPLQVLSLRQWHRLEQTNCEIVNAGACATCPLRICEVCRRIGSTQRKPRIGHVARRSEPHETGCGYWGTTKSPLPTVE